MDEKRKMLLPWRVASVMIRKYFGITGIVGLLVVTNLAILHIMSNFDRYTLQKESNVVSMEAAPFAPVGQASTRLFYNRIPKCGSSSVDAMIRAMALQNKFDYKYSTIFRERRIGIQKQREFVDKFMGIEAPMLYNRHLHYINFTRMGFPQPGYINVVRTPMERYMSNYYFEAGKAKDRLFSTASNATHIITELAKINKTLDECVLGPDDECKSIDMYFALTSFLCGHEDFCAVPSEASVARAKYNVVNNYLLVGITEDLPSFAEGLELLLPRFFKGAREWFAKSRPHKNISPGKRYSQATYDFMQVKLKEENEVYSFTRQLFYEKVASWKRVYEEYAANVERKRLRTALKEIGILHKE